MKQYRITAYYTTSCFVYVEAEDEDQAYDMAREMDGASFTNTDKGDWRIVDVEGISEECHYCGGNCLQDEEYACDGYLGDIDKLYAKKVVEQ